MSEADDALCKHLLEVIQAPKAFSIPPSWEEDQEKYRFSISLDREGVTLGGITLFGRATKARPDQDITIGLRCRTDMGRQRNFDRGDWRPMSGHNNRNQGPKELRLIEIRGTHRHPLSENAGLECGIQIALRENLPIALPMPEEADSWECFTRLLGEAWNLPDLAGLAMPPVNMSLWPPTGGEGSTLRKKRR